MFLKILEIIDFLLPNKEVPKKVIGIFKENFRMNRMIFYIHSNQQLSFFRRGSDPRTWVYYNILLLLEKFEVRAFFKILFIGM